MQKIGILLLLTISFLSKEGIQSSALNSIFASNIKDFLRFEKPECSVSRDDYPHASFQIKNDIIRLRGGKRKYRTIGGGPPLKGNVNMLIPRSTRSPLYRMERANLLAARTERRKSRLAPRERNTWERKFLIERKERREALESEVRKPSSRARFVMKYVHGRLPSGHADQTSARRSASRGAEGTILRRLNITAIRKADIGSLNLTEAELDEVGRIEEAHFRRVFPERDTPAGRDQDREEDDDEDDEDDSGPGWQQLPQEDKDLLMSCRRGDVPVCIPHHVRPGRIPRCFACNLIPVASEAAPERAPQLLLLPQERHGGRPAPPRHVPGAVSAARPCG